LNLLKDQIKFLFDCKFLDFFCENRNNALLCCKARKYMGVEILLEIADRLLGPQGCPWDRKQTLFSLQAYLLEEMHELIEAIDGKDTNEMKEEAGDLLWTLVFVCKLAEEKKYFTFQEVVDAVSEKLIRRHPHIFGDRTANNAEEVLEIWQDVKKKEKKRASALFGIPKSLPLVARAQKTLGRIKKNAPFLVPEKESAFDSEEELGEALVDLLMKAEKSHFAAEDVLRRKLSQLEKKFAKWEEKNIPETSS
jgi:tetrapyrrole methylase family protein / MazG family protein